MSIMEGNAGIPIRIPVTQREILDRVNRRLAADRQRLFLDEGRVVWIDLRKAKEIDLEEYARRHELMEPEEKLSGT